MAVVYKTHILSAAGATVNENGYGFTVQFEVSGFSEANSDRLFEALNASGAGSNPSVPSVGDSYSSISSNVSGLPSGVLDSIVDSIEVVEVDCGSTMAVLTTFTPAEESSRSWPEPSTRNGGVLANGTTSLQTRPRNHDKDGNEIKLQYIPPGETLEAAKHEELITLDILEPTRVRNYEFVHESNPETLASNTIGKVDGSRTWIGYAMNYTKLRDGNWRVAFQAAYNKYGWDPYKVYTLSNGKIPSDINLSNVANAGDIPVALGAVNGAIRPESYETWSLAGFPANVSGDF